MPPGPTYNFLCALNTAANILSHAAQYRASQIAAQAAVVSATKSTTSRRLQENVLEAQSLSSVETLQKEPRKYVETVPVVDEAVETASKLQDTIRSLESTVVEEEQHLRNTQIPAEAAPIYTGIPFSLPKSVDTAETDSLQAILKLEPESAIPVFEQSTPGPFIISPISRNLQSSRVPSSRLGRLAHYGGLAASLGYGAASEFLRRSTSSNDITSSSSVMMSEANIKRLVAKLSQMRGAALKLGQFLSIQDTHGLPSEIDKVFRRVQDSAHYMPDWQLEHVLQSSLGPSYASNFSSFSRIPFAAASIGQVHSAVLTAEVSPTGKEVDVAVKVQFPNIANSIESDIGYVKMLLTAGRMLPRGLFLDRTIAVMKDELKDECDYSREASFLRRFGSAEFLGNDPKFKVPWVWEGSTKECLVMEKVEGVSVGEQTIGDLSQQHRNDIASRIIELCLRELFEFRIMQTDPNWTNFLWNAKSRQVELVDFGATREYSKDFMDNWLRLLSAAASEDREACIEWSLKVGYLTGEENELMLDAHVNSMALLATPFKANTPQPFSFARNSQWADITQRIRNQIPVMLKHRLTPPPRETYSLNRKLSGAFLLASRLNAEVNTKELWDSVVGKYRFD